LERCLTIAVVVVVLAMVLIPPFTAPPILGWRWVTDQVPWQVVDRVPWSPYPRTATHVTVDNGNGVCINEHIGAFGLIFDVPTAPGGPIRQLSRTHFVYGGVSITGGKFDDLDCAIR